MPEINLEASNVFVEGISSGKVQVCLNVESFDDEDAVIDILDDDAILKRAAELGWIDADNETAVQKAAEDLGLLNE